MLFPKDRKLFTVKEMCRACGVSRATLIRMEEDGFLTPYRVDPDTGYRYYDTQNVTAVGQYQRLQTIGLSRKEIADLYYERVDSAAFLEELRQKQSRLERFLTEYELRHDRSKNYSFSYVTLPALTYYCADVSGPSLAEAETQAYLAHEKCVETGYRMLGSEPIMVLFDDPRAFVDPLASEYRCTLCIPVIPDTDPKEDTNLRPFPATEAFAILGFGEYSVIPGLWARLFEEVGRRRLEPSGAARLVSLIAPYAGAHYSPKDFCHHCVIPIRERKE